MRAMELIGWGVTNPSTTFTTVVMAPNDSNTVRNFEPPNRAWIEDVWTQQATTGEIRITSPRMHDNAQGIRLGSLAATPQPLLPSMVQAMLYPQDLLAIQQTGGGSELDGGTALVVYEDLPGSAARLYSWQQVKPNIKSIMSVLTTHTTGGTAFQWGGSVGITSVYNTFKANEDYALLGYLVSASACSIGWRSSDFGNLRLGGPGTTQRMETRDYFIQLDARMDGPCIPVFNAANYGNTFVDILSSVTSTALSVWSIFAELGRI